MLRTTALLFLLFPAWTAQAAPNRGPFRRIAVIELHEASDEAIDPSVKKSVLRRLKLAQQWGADCIVFDIQSYGGLVTSSIETADEIFAIGRKHPGHPEQDIHTVAYVGRRAISGASMISIACQEIVMSEVATLGDSQVIYLGADHDIKKAPEKMQTTVAAKFRQYAGGNGYPVPLAEAMVRQEMEVTRYKKPDDPGNPSGKYTWVYYRTDTPDGGPSRKAFEELGLYDPEVVVPEHELATLLAKDAVKYGFASRLEPDLDSFLASIRGPGTEVRRLGWNWAERASRWLLGIKALLFLVGIGALYFALKTPGTGIPEILALICFGLFFGASAVADMVGPIEVLLFLAGLLLIAIEIFLIPGFGVTGILGLAAVLVAVGMAAIPQGASPTSAATPEFYLLPMARDFLLGAAGAILGVMVLVRNLPRVPFLRRFDMQAAAVQTGSAVQLLPHAGKADSLIGGTGVAATILRPSGRATIGGKTYDVVSEGAYLPAGTRVRVVALRGKTLLVRRSEEEENPA